MKKVAEKYEGLVKALSEGVEVVGNVKTVKADNCNFQLNMSDGCIATCDTFKVLYRMLQREVKNMNLSGYIFNERGVIICRVDKEICDSCMLENCNGCKSIICQY